MDCRDAQFYLRLRRHAADELGADVTGPLDAHLARCPACAADGRAAASFDRAMASAMRAVPVPADLHARIVRHVASKQGAALRRRAYRVGALAAAAVLVRIPRHAPQPSTTAGVTIQAARTATGTAASHAPHPCRCAPASIHRPTTAHRLSPPAKPGRSPTRPRHQKSIAR